MVLRVVDETITTPASPSSSPRPLPPTSPTRRTPPHQQLDPPNHRHLVPRSGGCSLQCVFVELPCFIGLYLYPLDLRLKKDQIHGLERKHDCHIEQRDFLNFSSFEYVT